MKYSIFSLLLLLSLVTVNYSSGMLPINSECNRFDEDGLFIFAPLNHYVLTARLENAQGTTIATITSINKEWAHFDLKKQLTQGYRLIEILTEQPTGPVVTQNYLEQSIRIEAILDHMENDENLYFKKLPIVALQKIADYMLWKDNFKNSK